MKIKLDEKNIRWGVTAFLVVLCSIIVFFIIYRFSNVGRLISKVSGILMPFVYGLIMAYLLCPIYNFIVRHMYRLIKHGERKFKKALTVSKAFATIVALVFMVIVVAGVLWMIIPGLIDSVMKIIGMLPSSMDSLKDWLDLKLVNYPQAKGMLDSWINNFTENAVNFVMDKLLPEYTSIAIGVSEGVISIFNVLKNLLIGVIVCAYFLNSKDVFAAQSKKVIVALFSENTAEEILNGAAFTNRTFGGFINGKIIDSLIIGVICFIVMSLFGWEYTLLISCIIGITNIIPFFGPFIGAIPSALLILMVDARQCIYFLIFILILQQFDGNILGPKILGDTTGLASFWVLFAILVGGGLFGFVGMVVGIPVFAVIYAYTSRAINGRLKKRGFSIDIADYKIDDYRIDYGKKSESKIRKILKKGGKENGGENDQ